MNAYINPNPQVFIAILCMGVLMLVLPRKFALIPLFVAATYVTLGQYLLIASGHFTMVRILVVFGFVRAALRKEYEGVASNPIDRAVVWWIVASIAAYTLLWATPQAFVNRIGFCFDSVGIYFLCRIYLRDLDDSVRTLTLCAVLMVPLAVSMLYEYRTGHNLFHFLGGVPELSEVRYGKVRCQGSFRHPILMGTFGATMVPLIIALWWQKAAPKKIIVAGGLSALVITWCSGSSGALMTCVYGTLGVSFWFLRDRMKMVRWSIVAGLIALQLVMKAPVWYILSRMSLLSGGTGWHRAYLIDQAIRYFNEWWLVGTRVTAHWMPTGLLIDANQTDITNQYLVQGVNGGLLTMLLFVLIMVRCYKAVGNVVASLEDFPSRIFVWSMGATLFAHTLAFFSVSYFDQIQVFWYLLLAIIAASRDTAVIKIFEQQPLPAVAAEPA